MAGNLANPSVEHAFSESTQADKALQQGSLHAAADVGPGAGGNGSPRRRTPAPMIAKAEDVSPQTGDARFPFVGSMTWLGVALAVVFYVADSLLDAYAFGAGRFPTLLYDVEPEEFWLRAFGMSLLVVLGAYTQATITRRAGGGGAAGERGTRSPLPP